MTRLAHARTTALAALLLLVMYVPAAHASGKDVIRDCTDDEVLTKTYTQADYKQALSQLASDSDQYSNCRSVIKRAQLAALRGKQSKRANSPAGAGGAGAGGAGAGGAGGGPGAGAAPPGSSGQGGAGFGSAPARDQLRSATPDERRAVDKGRVTAAKAVDLRGVAVAPGVSSDGALPGPLVVLLALVIAGALALAAIRIRALVLARRA